MSDHDPDPAPFASLNRAYDAVFRPGRLSLGLVVPLEAYAVGAHPTLAHHIERAQLAESLGFGALWLRDVPFEVPSFGDVGQILDPFVYLGALAIATESIGLGVASVILPLRHPAHVGKAAASVDQLSGGRMLLGVASGDRPAEYPALAMSFPDRGERFRESMAYIRALAESKPRLDNHHGQLPGTIDMLPKPVGPRIPLLITGGSQQSPQWVAEHGDGWMTYPRDPRTQARLVGDYRHRIAESGGVDKPVMQSLYVDLVDDRNAAPRPIHLGFRSGVSYLRSYLRQLQGIGVNHVALNLRFHTADIEQGMRQLAEHLLPEFGT